LPFKCNLQRYNTEPSIFTAKDPRKPAFFWRLFNDILVWPLHRWNPLVLFA
jgi:hypothetical protein